jgi:hypothetical protein
MPSTSIGPPGNAPEPMHSAGVNQMGSFRISAVVAMAVVLLGACDDDNGPAIGAPPPTPPPSTPVVVSTNAVILDWNQRLTQSQGAGNLYSFRQYAILHIAMFDAANSVQQLYTPYLTSVSGSTGASEEAAAAQAAHDVMVALYPASTADFDSALATRLATIPQAAAAQGAEVGRQVAQAVLQWRAADGSANPDPAYSPPALPGLWQPASAGQVAAGTRFPNMKPFALLTPTQYLPVPFPPLNSAEYAESFQQVYELGRVDSVVRTAEQTQLARLIAGVNFRPSPFAMWNAVARDLATSRQMSLVDTARLFALLNASMHDGLLTSQTSKYVYQLWRPVTAIAHADADMNDATTADATWAPLLGTPPYPSHASNVSCIATSASRVLAQALGNDQIPFSVTWTWTGAAGAGADVTRQYTALSQLADEAAMSRVYGGIHFEFELTASAESCTKVADYVYSNFMRR